MDSITFVGLDVHADSITAAILHGQSQKVEVIELSSDLMKVRRLFRRLSNKGPIRACYEASGAGFVLQRVLFNDGFHCDVIAPSLIPRRPGDRRKTDRLDAIMLARLYRSGHLTAVHVPTENREALRRLLRLRTTYHTYCTATMHRISGVLRNHGFVFTQGRHIHVRRLLVEAAWNNRHRAGADLILNRRRQGQPPAVVAIALKAQHRLSKKFWHLDQHKHRHVAITAVARELCGFVWAILNQLQPTTN
jgi:hypothetical protein